MAIKVRCESCGIGFKAKNALAGRRVPCPKCKQPIDIPRPEAAQGAVAAAGAAAQPAGGGYNPLLDLLDEAGVESTPRGPTCESCGMEMPMNAVVCVHCGYNRETGRRMETAVFDDDEESSMDGGMTDADKIMARAEQEIDDMPVTAVGQDFGDGADSIVIAGVSFIVLLVLVAIGVGTIFIMDSLAEVINSAKISFYASMLIAIGCMAWISIVAFLTKSSQGMICICTLGLYCIIFGFMQGKALLLPTIILLLSIMIGLVSSFFAFRTDNGLGMLVETMLC
ncbi:MAG: hypothetical protein AAF456_14830 [Planctomycetota bacterium]